MQETTKTVIEINGVKMEVDLRHAVRIDQLRVGDRVKVLTKQYSDYQVSAGVVIGFENFKKLPTIIIAHITQNFSSAALKFLYFNSDTKDVEIIKAIDDDQLDLDKTEIISKLDKEILKHQREIEQIEQRKKYFLSKFQAYWTPVDVESEA